jgi:antitoxin (DNA-binding transcriptional repressor) of toxin-antitoxin stability system
MLQLTISQIQSKYKALVAALKRGETVEIIYHGQILRVVYPISQIINTQEQQTAMNAFFGLHKDSNIASVEEELRIIRKGRQNKLGRPDK